VQGVWFRDSTRREAERLGLTGHAKNLPNGDVEVLASGSAASLAELASWLREGPPLAKVSEVLEKSGEQAKLESRTLSGFEVG
jgi:acylphosphatase